MGDKTIKMLVIPTVILMSVRDRGGKKRFEGSQELALPPKEYSSVTLDVRRETAEISSIILRDYSK